MSWKLLASLACSAALVLGACSSNNTTSTGSSNSGGEGQNGGGTGSATSPELRAAQAALETAEASVAEARRLATMGTAADRNNADSAITKAETDIAAALQAANAAVTAAGDDDSALRDAALAALEAARSYQTRQVGTDESPGALASLRTSLAWFNRKLARINLGNGEAQMPGRAANTVTRRTISRTNSQGALVSDRFQESTFKSIMYSQGKTVFSNSGDEFQVHGFVGTVDSSARRNGNDDERAQTGLKITNDGVVIRTGGDLWNSRNVYFADRLKDITEPGTDRNLWDLEIEFDKPLTILRTYGSGDSAKRWDASWTGNGDFYWKGIVEFDASQRQGGVNYRANMFDNSAAGGSATTSPPENYRDLGIYELWLSNHTSVDRNMEPSSGAGTHPDDDVQQYLSYAAYGLFIYTPNSETFRDQNEWTTAGQVGRVQPMYFGYEAFADSVGRRTIDISKAITSGTFQGETTAYAMKGEYKDPANIETKLLRGNVLLTVSIPKDREVAGNEGSISGRIDGFQEWTGNSWQDFSSQVEAVLLHGRTGADDSSARRRTRAAIGADGKFETYRRGITLQIGENFIKSDGSGLIDASGSDATGDVEFNPDGAWKGNFYGPRTDTDLEIAGSWYTGYGGNRGRWDMFGSFGAKQVPDEN